MGCCNNGWGGLNIPAVARYVTESNLGNHRGGTCKPEIVTLSMGSSFLLLDGSASLIHTGAVIDVTSGSLLLPRTEQLLGKKCPADS